MIQRLKSEKSRILSDRDEEDTKRVGLGEVGR